MITSLLDADIIIYRAATTCEDADLDIAKDQYKRIRDSWVDASRADAYAITLSRGKSFRKNFYPQYKSDRDNKPRPRHLSDLREYVMATDHWIGVDGFEADDILGILGTSHTDVIITSVDKDLDQIPGLHCNPDRQEIYDIDEDSAHLSWALQLLTGDATDCYAGIPGIGEKKAHKILDDCAPGDRWPVIVKAYESKNLDAGYLSQMVVCATIMKDLTWSSWSQDMIDQFIARTFQELGLPSPG